MAEKLILVDLNLNGNKLKNVAVEVLSAAPANPVTGQFYVNSTDGKFYYYNGTKWVAGAEYSMANMSDATGTFPIYNQTADTLFKLNVLQPSGNLTMAEENGVITIGINEANLSVSTAVATAIANAKAEVIGESTDTYTADTVKGAKKYADKKVADLDYDDTAVTNEFVTEVDEVDGVISVKRARPTAGNIAVTGITGVTGTDAQTVLESLKALLDSSGAAGVVTIAETAGASGTNVLKTYTFSQGGTQIGTVTIPKDFLVKSGQVRTCTTDDDPVEGYVVGDKYLDFVVNSVDGEGQESHIYILVKDLVDIYTGGNGIDVSNSNVISITIDQTSEGFLTVGANGLKLSGVQTAITTAIEALDSSVAANPTGPTAAPASPAIAGEYVLTGVTEADGKLTTKTEVAVDKWGSAQKALDDAKSYTDTKKSAIDDYTVNGTKISQNPVISANVAQGHLTAQDSGCEVTTPVPGSIKAFYNGAEVAVAIAYNGSKATITWNGSLKLDIYYLATAVTVSSAPAA